MLYCMAVQHYVRVRCIIIHACVEGYDTRILERVAHIRMSPHPTAKFKYLGLI